ncbi:glycosyltransferase family 4 protein [Peribacillus butanolivorans]|uniref:glycosyltransferase family 4 protein n=1 Tax=Peribacillus butanolivorans TaxID=421767 RepID=UPI0036D9DB16
MKLVEEKIDVCELLLLINISIFQKNRSKIMKSILYITILPKEYGGKTNGGIATHSVQLILKAKNEYRVGLYSDIKEIKELDEVILYTEDNRLIKIIKSLYAYITIEKEKINKIRFLKFKDRLRVLYHYCNLKSIVPFYNVVHIHSLHNDCVTALSLLNNKPRIVVTDHGFWQGNVQKDIEKVRYNSFTADKVIYISDYAKLKYKEYKLNTVNLTKIYNPFSEKKIITRDQNEIKKNLNIDKNKKVIFFSGVSDPVKRKGLDILLESISSDDYLRENTILIIIANEEGLNYAEKYSNVKNIIALKPMPYEDIINYYNISDIFVLPSRSESFGLVYIESLSYGTPVIGFDKVIQEFQNLYSHLYIGESFNPLEENYTELASKIKMVLSKEVNPAALIEKTNELFSWENLFYKFQNVYRGQKEK